MKLIKYGWENFHYHFDMDDLGNPIDNRPTTRQHNEKHSRIYKQLKELKDNNYNKDKIAAFYRNNNEDKDVELLIYAYDNEDLESEAKQLFDESSLKQLAEFIIDYKKDYDEFHKKMTQIMDRFKSTKTFSKRDIAYIKENSSKIESETSPMYACYKPVNKRELKNIIESLDSDSNLNWIDVSGIEDFSDLFENLSFFNGDISLWNVCNAKNMEGMFSGCTEFNGDISSWDVSKAKGKMNNMFQGCISFDQSNIKKWEIEDKTKLFTDCPVRQYYKYNESIKIYDTTNDGTDWLDLAKNCFKTIIDTMEEESFPFRNFMFHKYHQIWWKEEMKDLLSLVPVCIVKGGDDENQTITFGGGTITIPTKADPGRKGYRETDENKDNSEKDLKEWIDKIKEYVYPQSFAGLNNGSLGMYIRDDRNFFKHMIVIWYNEIEDEAKNYCNNKVADLLKLTIIHEFAHALMDVVLYQANLSDCECMYNGYKYNGYNYIEEALANAFALRALKNDELVDIDNLVSYVSGHNFGYKRGADIYENSRLFQIMNEWMKMKVIVDNVTYNKLNSFYHNGNNFDKLLDEESSDQTSIFYPMANRFINRCPNNRLSENHTLIMHEDEGFFFSDDYTIKIRENRSWEHVD